jgi:hypothetical protein
MSPVGLDEALAKRAEELTDVKIKAVMALPSGLPVCS